MGRDRDDRGRYTESASPQTVLDVLADSDDPVMTAAEIAAVLDVSNDTVLRRLDELHEQGNVKRKEVGARAVVWW